MRAATLTVLALVFVAHASAQAQQRDSLRMGPQLTGLRNPLDQSRNWPAARGFTPAHMKGMRSMASPGSAYAADAPGQQISAVQQVQATADLPAEPVDSPTLTADATQSVLVQGEPMMVDNTPIDIEFDVTGEIIAGDTFGSGCCGDSCGGCFDCCIQLPRLCLPRLPKDNLTFFAGVQGFKGPVNRGEDGSFGFHQGFNWGVPLSICGGGLGAQLGIRGVQSNFHGTDFTADDRSQFFLTAGLFRRADCGFQFGGAIDFQHDDWYAQSDLSQFRGEISWVNGCASEIGFMLAAGGSDEAGTATLRNDQNGIFTVTESRLTTDYYAFFYRHRLDCGAGDWRLYGGFTENSEGLIGGDIEVALSNCLSLQSGYTYLIPEENTAGGGNLDEAWNVGISIVFHPWGGARTKGNYYRPLFNVADNGSFLVDIQ